MSKHCDICIGCGRCVGEKQDIHVLTKAGEGVAKPETVENFFFGEADNGHCLVVADIGTTTIAMQLYDGNGRLQDTYAQVNPQAVYGADVLSRIQAAENPADAERMRQQVFCVLEQGLGYFREKLKDAEAWRMVMAANTTMVYLLMGWDTAELGKAPFYASHLEAVETTIGQVPCYIFPGASAFVGGDIVAGILATGMNEREAITLLIDLGTNGEMVLGNRDKMLACATAAGPAFEGGVNRGVWGADMIHILAKLRRKNLVDETGLLADPYFEKGVRVGDVCVTQEAVRAIQLAKGAIAAGIQILTKEYGISMGQIDRVVLAGGFGYYLNPKAAAEIGLLPNELVQKTIAGGNTALAGAYRFGRRQYSHADMQQISSVIKIIHLAENPSFYDSYLASMNLISK